MAQVDSKPGFNLSGWALEHAALTRYLKHQSDRDPAMEHTPPHSESWAPSPLRCVPMPTR